MTTNNKIAGFETHKTSGLEERHTCGSSRVGVRNSGIDLLPLPTQNYGMRSVHYSIGSRTYELSNQLPSVLPSAVGNVLSVISDKVIPQFTSSTVISEMRADIRGAQDYSPFGVTLDGRNFVVSEGYRYGFNGMEEDKEVKGDNNSYDFGARMYDPRIGRWLSIDPLADKYPSLSPYNFVANCPIKFVDPDGEKIIINYGEGQKYEYGSGLKLPRDRFVRKTVRTLRRIEKSGRDPMGIILNFRVSNTDNVEINFRENWYYSPAIASGKDAEHSKDEQKTWSKPEEGVSDKILWNPHSGLISRDGRRRQSAASNLLHELAHAYYRRVDPEGKYLQQQNMSKIEDEKAREAAREEYKKREINESGEYHNYEDKWIIQNVESQFKEDKRSGHGDGYLLKTIGGSFSRIGFKYQKRNEFGKTKDLKK